FLDSQRRAGLSVYVHCKAGVSRAGLVTVGYLMWREGWSRDAALQFVRFRRSHVRPNPAFMALLLEWEQFLHGRGDRQRAQDRAWQLNRLVYGSLGISNSLTCRCQGQ